MLLKDNKIYYLDGIRGLAALFVFFHHFLLVFYPAYYDWDPKNVNLHGWEISYGQSILSFLSNGNFCVEVFFVLSGYVLSRKYFLENRFEILVSGAQRRFLRLYIPVATTLLIAFALMKADVFYNVMVSKIAHSEWWFSHMWTFPDPGPQLWRCLKYATMFQGENMFDTSLWSISLELYGSLFVFAFLALTHNTKNRLAMLILVFVFARILRNSMFASFALGMSLNYIEQVRQKLNKNLVGCVVIVLLPLSLVLGSYSTTGVTVGTIFEYVPEKILFNYSSWFHIFGAYLLIVAFVLSPMLQQSVSSKFFRFLGYISFSFYLLHPLILGSFSSYLFMRIYKTLDYGYAVLIVFVATVGFGWALSWLMAKYVDGPGTNFAKYVYNRWSKKKSETIAPDL